MSNLNYDPVYLEILRMAKDLVMQEYTDIRAQDHNKWLVESEHLWKTQRLRLAYPTIPVPPTERDIIARAQILLNFLAKEETKKNIVDQTLTTKEMIELEEQELNTVKEDNVNINLTQISSSTLWVKIPEGENGILKTGTTATILLTTSTLTGNSLIISSDPTITQSEQSKTGGTFLPSVLKRIEELKNNWSK